MSSVYTCPKMIDIFLLQLDRWTNDAMHSLLCAKAKTNTNSSWNFSLYRIHTSVYMQTHTRLFTTHIYNKQYKTSAHFYCLVRSHAQLMRMYVTHSLYQYHWITYRRDQWSKKKKNEEKKVTSIALAWVCQWTLSNHFYRFDVSSAWRIYNFFFNLSSISIG